MATDIESSGHHKAQIFDHLVEAGQWQRVLEMGPQLLCDDPEDVAVHNAITLAALETSQLKLADHHSQVSIRLEPEDPFPHRLRARYYRAINRQLLAKQSILEALQLDPEDSQIWAEYGWNCYERGDLYKAREACANARALAPDNHSTEMLETAIEGAIDAPERLSAYEQIEAYQNSLRYDPECAITHFNIGITYLEELDDGKNAAEWLKKAATLDPESKSIQKYLHRSICRCDPVLKTINAPIIGIKRAAVWLENLRARHPICVFLLLPVLFAAILVAFLLGGIWIVFLLVPGTIYKWLTYSELIAKATGGERPRNGIYRLPLWSRILLSLIFSIPTVYGFFWLLTDPKAERHLDKLIGGGMIIGMIIGLWVSAKKHSQN